MMLSQGQKKATAQMQTAPRSGPEYCPRHNEANVGYIEEGSQAKEIVCNTCIFEKKLNAVKFTALVSKELKAQFAQQFQTYKQSMDSVQSIDPNLVKQRASILVQKFFQNLAEKVASLQKSVMFRIKQSESLKELEKILEQSREFFPNDQNTQDHFEREKKIFDMKIDKGRFSYLVKRQEFYQTLITSLDQSSEKMRYTIDQSTDQVQRVLKLRTDSNVVQ